MKRKYKEMKKAKSSQFNLYSLYKVPKDTEDILLSEYPVSFMRTGLKAPLDAYKQSFKKIRSHPIFKKEDACKEEVRIRRIRRGAVHTRWGCPLEAEALCETAGLWDALHESNPKILPHL